MRFGLDGIPLEQKKTGVGHYTFELARSLAAIAPEHEFEIISPSGFHLDPDSSQSPNLHFQSRSGSRLSRRLWWAVDLPLYCRKASLALFHGTNYDLPYWSLIPTVLTIHDLSPILYPQTHEKHLVRRARLRLPHMARKASAIITPCKTVKGEVSKHLKVAADKIFTIPNAARSCFYRVSLEETTAVRARLGVEDEFILFVGTIEPRKNLLTLVRALGELLRTASLRSQLVIAGKEGWLSNELMTYLNESDIKERVLFTGHLSDDDLRDLYSACRVFVYPSLYEGFGLPLIEAMACGAPVVTSNVPSIVETVEDVARLVSPTDFRDLAQGLARLLQDDGEREYRSRAGLKHAKKFSWERTASATLEVYENAVMS